MQRVCGNMEDFCIGVKSFQQWGGTLAVFNNVDRDIINNVKGYPAVT